MGMDRCCRIGECEFLWMVSSLHGGIRYVKGWAENESCRGRGKGGYTVDQREATGDGQYSTGESDHSAQPSACGSRLAEMTFFFLHTRGTF